MWRNAKPTNGIVQSAAGIKLYVNWYGRAPNVGRIFVVGPKPYRAIRTVPNMAALCRKEISMGQAT